MNKLRKFIKLLIFKTIQLNGHSYRIQIMTLDRLAIHTTDLSYEPEVVALYEKELNENKGYFIDVGANQGQTLLAVLSVSKNIPYIGIEPQPTCVANILAFLQLNQLSNHRIICACLSDKESITHLELSYAGDVRASIISDFRPGDTFTCNTPTVTLQGDKLISDLGLDEVQFIKIDVEGAELEVLQSFRHTLINHKPTITFEILPDILVSTGQKLPVAVIVKRREREAVISGLLQSVNYACKLLTIDGEVPIEIAPDPDGLVRNYVARHFASH